jgi:putative transcriptional regulator
VGENMLVSADSSMSQSKDTRQTIKELRAKLGLTQFQLAVKSGVNLSTVVNAENGKRIPDVDNAIKIARALDTTVENIVWERHK